MNASTDKARGEFLLSRQDGTVLIACAKSIRVEAEFVEADGQIFNLDTPIRLVGSRREGETSYDFAAGSNISGSLNPWGEGPVDIICSK